MKRAGARTGFLLLGVWITTSALADPGHGIHGAAFQRSVPVRDANIAAKWRGRSPREGERPGPGPNAYSYRYDYGNRRDKYHRHHSGDQDGTGPYDYADPYGYGYPDNYPYLGINDGDAYPPEYPFQEPQTVAPDAAPPVTTGVGLVTAVQTKLSRQAYYDGPLNGTINEEMRNAIREYQEDHGLPVTGLISPELLSSMAIRYVWPLA